MLRFYFVAKKGKKVTAYGPFPDARSAEIAGYLFKPASERDVAASTGRLRVHFMTGVESYDEREVQALKDDPQEYGHASFIVKGAKAIPVHESWKDFMRRDASFVPELIERDLATAAQR